MRASSLLNLTALAQLGPPTQPNFKPWPNGIPNVPKSCTNTADPSRACYMDLEKRSEKDAFVLGGYWMFADHVSEDDRKTVTRAGLDAHNLAHEAAAGWNATIKGRAAASYYIGPDWEDQADRIQGNFDRARDWRPKGFGYRTYITINTNDPEKLCGLRNGLTVGGYAWQVTGFFGVYDYINLCPIFFTEINLDERFNEVTRYQRDNETARLVDMNYYKTTGQNLLHEMLHTYYIGDPHIRDERIGGNGPKAYGPYWVHRLAQLPRKDGGGVQVSSTNADSYSMLANAVFWQQLNGGYFPGRGTKRETSADSIHDLVIDAQADLNGIIINLGDIGEPSKADIPKIFADWLHKSTVNDLGEYLAAQPVDTNGGAIRCQWSTGSIDSYMTPDTARARAAEFCDRIEDGVVFKPNGGTPLQATAYDGKNPATYSATWKGGDNCPTLDFSKDASRNICKNRLYVVVDKCDKDKINNDAWRGAGTFSRDCIEWGITGTGA